MVLCCVLQSPIPSHCLTQQLVCTFSFLQLLPIKCSLYTPKYPLTCCHVSILPQSFSSCGIFFVSWLVELHGWFLYHWPVRIVFSVLLSNSIFFEPSFLFPFTQTTCCYWDKLGTVQREPAPNGEGQPLCLAQLAENSHFKQVTKMSPLWYCHTHQDLTSQLFTGWLKMALSGQMSILSIRVELTIISGSY